MSFNFPSENQGNKLQYQPEGCSQAPGGKQKILDNQCLPETSSNITPSGETLDTHHTEVRNMTKVPTDTTV